jgi:hypothetical protein
MNRRTAWGRPNWPINWASMVAHRGYSGCPLGPRVSIGDADSPSRPGARDLDSRDVVVHVFGGERHIFALGPRVGVSSSDSSEVRAEADSGEGKGWYLNLSSPE